MSRVISCCSIAYISDWNFYELLGPVFKKKESDHNIRSYVRFDYDRLLADISRNLLRNAYLGGGSQIDLVYKQAALNFDYYQALTDMWGEPLRIIYCYREPSRYMDSAQKKFKNSSIKNLENTYLQSFENYLKIGGSPFEYKSDLTKFSYTDFLSGLQFNHKLVPKFKGNNKKAKSFLATQKMIDVYQRLSVK